MRSLTMNMYTVKNENVCSTTVLIMLNVTLFAAIISFLCNKLLNKAFHDDSSVCRSSAQRKDYKVVADKQHIKQKANL